MRPPFGSQIFERAQDFVDRRRLLLGLCVAVAVALVAAVPGILTSDDSGRNVRTAEFAQVTPTTALPAVGFVSPLQPQQVASPAAAPSPTTTRPATVLGTTFSRPKPTTAPPKPAPKPAAPAPRPNGSPPPPPPCRNSYDPACGAFRWDPNPGPNQPMTGQVSFDPPAPKAGDTVTFHIVASDPDAQPVTICNAKYGGSEPGYVCDPAPRVNPSSCPAQYGPWTPPARQPGNLDTFDPHTYANPGKYEVSFDLGSAMGDCNNPYASGMTVSTTVVVS